MTSAAHEEARRKYIAEYPRFVDAADRMRGLMETACVLVGSPKAHVTVRAKEVGSFVKKLRKYDDDCWEKTTDKVGAQIVPRTLREVATLRQYLEAGPHGLIHLYTDDKAETEDPKKLHYSGVHIQVIVPGLMTSEGEPIECEIQLRTVALDLWASLEHGFIYKPVLAPSRQITRRIARLSVLVEMFDEEVDHVMDEIESDPRYEDGLLLRLAEAQYHGFVSEPGDEALSLEVIHAVQAAFEPTELVNYRATLQAFVDDNRPRLTEIFGQYGIGTSYAEQFSYFLFSQPESIIVSERIVNRPMMLAAAVRQTEIADAVGRVAEAWGSTLVLDV